MVLVEKQTLFLIVLLIKIFDLYKIVLAFCLKYFLAPAAKYV